jgi:hypothetical protein
MHAGSSDARRAAPRRQSDRDRERCLANNRQQFNAYRITAHLRLRYAYAYAYAYAYNNDNDDCVQQGGQHSRRRHPTGIRCAAYGGATSCKP